MGAPFPASPAWHVRARVGPAVCVGVAPALPLLENPALQHPGEPARLRKGGWRPLRWRLVVERG